MVAKAIETFYHGCLFRSRLEARWALFFDRCGYLWEYEREGYDLGDGLYYLPDFWLPQVSMWAEVKPVTFTTTEKLKATKLVEQDGHGLLMLVGLPDCVNYLAIERETWCGDALPWYNYSLIDKMIHKGEKRFPGGDFLPDHDPSCWPPEYLDAVIAAKSARFERQRHESYATV